jgi:hypothetical protein
VRQKEEKDAEEEGRRKQERRMPEEPHRPRF